MSVVGSALAAFLFLPFSSSDFFDSSAAFFSLAANSSMPSAFSAANFIQGKAPFMASSALLAHATPSAWALASSRSMSSLLFLAAAFFSSFFSAVALA